MRQYREMPRRDGAFARARARGASTGGGAAMLIIIIIIIIILTCPKAHGQSVSQSFPQVVLPRLTESYFSDLIPLFPPQVVLPRLTESYASSADPPEPTVPVCTIKTFPYTIEHTLQWARDVFEGEFVSAPQTVNSWLDDESYLDSLGADDGGRDQARGVPFHYY